MPMHACGSEKNGKTLISYEPTFSTVYILYSASNQRITSTKLKMPIDSLTKQTIPFIVVLSPKKVQYL